MYVRVLLLTVFISLINKLIRGSNATVRKQKKTEEKNMTKKFHLSNSNVHYQSY